MPQTVDIVAKELHYLVEFKASEIKKLVLAMSMCEGGPGVTEDEQKAWEFFVGDLFHYFSEIDKDLSRNDA